MRLTSEQHHLDWDASRAAVVTVDPGSEIEIAVLNASGEQLAPGSGADDVSSLDFSRVNPVTGPVAVDGAVPGDALIVTVLSIDLDDWGWTANIPGFGLLTEDFPGAHLMHSAVRTDRVELGAGPVLPLAPMIGTLGVAPAEPGAHSLVPPRRWGGNLDIRHLGPGTRIVLPVGVPGGLLSVGDTHAAMGDGEVCGTGLETGSTVRLRVDLAPGAAPRFPVLEGPAGHRPGDVVVTTGIGPDLRGCAQDATRAMVEVIVDRTGLAPIDAYLICSLTGDLVISEIVDAPNWVVSMHLPVAALAG